MVFVMLGLPALFAPVMGQVADRVSRRRLLIAAHLGITAVVASLFLVDSPEWLWLLYAVVVAYGAMGYLNTAAQAGLVRDILPDEHLASGNGLLTSVDQSLRGSYLVEISAGVRHLVRTPLLGRLTLLLAVIVAATGLVDAAAFPAIEQGLGLPASALGALVSAQGIGAIAGGLSAAWVIGRWGERRTFVIGTTLLGVGIAPVMGSSVTLVGLGMLVLGLGVTWAVVAYMVLRQRLTPPRLQARTSAAASMALNLPRTGTTAVAAALLGLVDYRLLVLATVVVVLAAALAAVRRASSRPPRSGRSLSRPRRRRG